MAGKKRITVRQCRQGLILAMIGVWALGALAVYVTNAIWHSPNINGALVTGVFFVCFLALLLAKTCRDSLSVEVKNDRGDHPMDWDLLRDLF